jgi:tetratricopeptide (TPR) repeat protein
MGVVYKARQVSLNRVVALKMILAGGHAGPDERARFLAEAEAIARVRHPGIVQVFDYGTHNGLPWFSLELCEGGSLAERLRQGPLPPREATEMVEKVARAVQAAHEGGVVHRDLKPGNVLLAHDGSPKITDFGLAKRADGGGQTQTGAVLGTPSYMAPEQAEGKKDVGPPADVYALGAILYECLTGRPPFKAATQMETVLQVMRQEPVPVRELQPQAPADLATICHKCLQKETHKRYASARELAEDCAAFLDGRPIRARPIGTAERAWRWCKRNPAIAWLLALVVLTVASALVGLTVLYFQAEEQRRKADSAREFAEGETRRARESAIDADNQRRRADTERDAAQQQAQRARQVSTVLTGMFNASDPIGLNGLTFGLTNRAGQSYTSRDLLERALQLTRDDARLAPAVKAEVYLAVGNVYRSLGLYKSAGPLLREALAIRKAPGTPPGDLALALHSLGWLHHEQGDYARAEALYREALRHHKNSAQPGGEAALNTRFNLAFLLLEMLDLEQAEEMLRAVVDERARLLGEDHRETAIARGALAAVYLKANRPLDAIPLVTKALATLKKLGIDQTTMNAATQFEQGVIRAQLFSDFDGAARHLREAIDLSRKALGPHHIYVGLSLAQLGIFLDEKKDHDGAIKAYTEALEVGRKTVGLAHPKVMELIRLLAAAHRKKGQGEKATALFREARGEIRERYGPGHVYEADALLSEADHEYLLGHEARQAELLVSARAIYQKATGRPPRQYPTCLNCLGCNHTRNSRYAEGEKAFREAVKVSRRLHKKPHDDLAVSLSNLAFALLRQGRVGNEADQALQEADRLIDALAGPLRQARREQWALLTAELSCRRDGDHRRAAAALDRASPGASSSDTLKELALAYVACLKALEKDATTSSREALREQYGASAVGLLRRAWKAAPKARHSWVRSPPAELEDRADFKALLAEIRGPKK